MSNMNYNAKDIVQKIVAEEKERQEAIKKLKQELSDIESQGDMCDTKRIIEIIDELNIIDPLQEVEEQKEVKKAMPKKRRYMPLKISAACIIVLLGIQAVSLTTFSGGSFLDSVANWSNSMISYMMGREINENGVDIIGSYSRLYTDIDEFRKKENLDVFIPESIDNSAFREISYVFENEKSMTVYYENGYILIIKLGHNSKFKFPDDRRTSYTHNNIEYLIDMDYGTISWLLDKNLYTLTYNFDSDSYEEIIPNIK